ncbi:hypothetical protein ASD99_22250 [Mesorhizobium sp. Root695]|nr:hypothetical protein ASD99_22250 [Mesorhizobium sp. Root695]
MRSAEAARGRAMGVQGGILIANQRIEAATGKYAIGRGKLFARQNQNLAARSAKNEPRGAIQGRTFIS